MSLGENSLVAAYQGRGQLKSRPSGTRVVTLSVYFFPPYFDHDAFMHHPMHVLDAPASSTGEKRAEITFAMADKWHVTDHLDAHVFNTAASLNIQIKCAGS